MSERLISRVGTLVAAAFAVTTIALPGAAAGAVPAQGPVGSTTLSLDGPAAAALRGQGVRVAPIAPASGGARRISLPVSTGLAGTKTTLLRYRGGLRFQVRANKRVALTGLGLRLGKQATLEAKLGGKTVTLFRLAGGRRSIDPVAGTAQLSGLRLTLTSAAARTLGQRLGLRLAGGRLGTLATSAARLTPGATATGGSPSSGGSGGSSPAQTSTSCPLPSGAGASAEANPPVAVRPSGAVDVTGASLQWHLRESFIRYIATGEGTSPVEGATADPPVLLPGASVPLSYDFRFPFANGWLDTGADPGSPADDRAALNFSGGLRFRYSAHGIDLLAANPELELAGGSSRAIFAVAENGGAAQRQVLVNLDLSRAGGISQSGNSFTYNQVPAAIPSGTASSTFAGFYAPGTDFGCFTISFSTGS